MAEIFRTRVWGTLAAGINGAALAVNLTAGHGARFGAIGAGEFIRGSLVSSSGQIEDVLITARAVDALTITRGAIPLAFVAGDRLECRINDLSMAGLAQAAHLQTNEKKFAVNTGSGDALVATLPATTQNTLVNGMEADVELTAANTIAAPTLKVFLGVTDTGDWPVVKGSDQALAIGDLPGANARGKFQWDASLSKWILINPATGVKRGKQTIWVPSASMVPRLTNGPTPSVTETAANKVMLRTLDFVDASDKFAQFQVKMPKGWDESTVSARAFWTAAAGAGAVVWGVQGVAVSDDDPLDGAFGAAQTMTDALIAANDLHISPESAAITVGGAPADHDLVTFQVYRDGDAAGDTFNDVAKLLGIELVVNFNASDDS
jgi:hypothetical protein